jgi:membrane fusion protein (multidrug efflux system)
MRFLLRLAVPLVAAPVLAHTALAQMPGGPPPAVGVVKVQQATITETSEFIGRVQAEQRVSLNARITAFQEERLFVEGTEVHAGDLLYRLERGPFEADVAQKESTVADASARLANATIQLNRAQALLATPAGQRSNVDDAVAAQRSQAAQLAGAQAALRTSRINLDYTEIRAPIDGQISRTSITPGNVVSPSSGPLATIVSQDPMYVTFPVAVRLLTDLRTRFASRGGLNAVQVRLKMSDGSLYNQTGKIDYIDPSVSAGTDTILVRGVIANPVLGVAQPGQRVERPLIDGEFVTVLVEGILPVKALAIPRAAVMSDQSGNYVYVVGPDNKVERRPIQLGQSTPSLAVLAGGLKEGETVILEGLQRARPDIQVSPAPAGFTPGSPAAGSSTSANSAPAAATPAASTPASSAPGSSTPASPTPASPTPGSPAPGSATPGSASPISPAPANPGNSNPSGRTQSGQAGSGH